MTRKQTQDAGIVADTQETQDADTTQDATRARRSFKERGTTLDVRAGHEMRYDTRTDFYRRERPAQSLATKDCGELILFSAMTDDGTQFDIIARYVATRRVDGIVVCEFADASNDAKIITIPLSRMQWIKRARPSDTRELRATRREIIARERPPKEKKERAQRVPLASLDALMG